MGFIKENNLDSLDDQCNKHNVLLYRHWMALSPCKQTGEPKWQPGEEINLPEKMAAAAQNLAVTVQAKGLLGWKKKRVVCYQIAGRIWKPVATKSFQHSAGEW